MTGSAADALAQRWCQLETLSQHCDQLLGWCMGCCAVFLFAAFVSGGMPWPTLMAAVLGLQALLFAGIRIRLACQKRAVARELVPLRKEGGG
jgi:hypothetical protein